MSNETSMHATTIVTVRKAGKVVIAGDRLCPDLAQPGNDR